METAIDQAKFEFRESDHAYLYEGKRMTGITSIIGVLAKPALIGWAARMSVEHIQTNLSYKRMKLLRKGYVIVKEKILLEALNAHTRKKEIAGEHGTDAHALVEEWIKWDIENPAGILTEETGKKFEPIMKFMEWATENVDHFLFAERRMFNLGHFIAGTADFAYIGKDGKKYMGDFKTSSGIYGIDYFLQVAAYRFLAEGEGDTSYDGTAIVRLGKKGDFEVQYRFDYQTDLEAFMACLTLYRAQATFSKVNKKSWK